MSAERIATFSAERIVTFAAIGRLVGETTNEWIDNGDRQWLGKEALDCLDAVAWLLREHARLRGLILDVEWAGDRQGDPCCPWCREEWRPGQINQHKACKAFSLPGMVR